jgi:hypothetical protein
VSEKVLKFYLDELQTIRVTCRNGVCGATVEAPIEHAEHLFSSQCPVCKKEYLGQPGSSPVALLAKVIRELAAVKGHVQIAFVLPDKSDVNPGQPR